MSQIYVDEDGLEQRSRMLDKLKMVWDSNPHLSFQQLVGFVTQGGSPVMNHRVKKTWAEQQNDACENRIDLALKQSGDEHRDIYGHYRPGHAPPPPPVPEINPQILGNYPYAFPPGGIIDAAQIRLAGAPIQGAPIQGLAVPNPLLLNDFVRNVELQIQRRMMQRRPDGTWEIVPEGEG